MDSIPTFEGVESTPGHIYVVEYEGAGYSFEERKEALRFADENDCYLVEGIKL